MPIPDFVVELRRHVGRARLWLPGVTAVVLRGEGAQREVLLVRRSDNGQWAPVTGIVDPGEQPAAAAVREAREETCTEIAVERLAWVHATAPVTHVNGDEAVYLDHTFACRWVGGEAAVGDDESLEVRWWWLSGLPPMREHLRERIDVVLRDEVAARFDT
ncbi:MAG: DNA mismatch repair protein MutT [Nocardioides sp.]|nr:DNA mismatch repair protein MutT [Nocardioides sp.]